MIAQSGSLKVEGRGKCFFFFMCTAILVPNCTMHTHFLRLRRSDTRSTSLSPTKQAHRSRFLFKAKEMRAASMPCFTFSIQSPFSFFFYCSIFLWYFWMILKRRTKQKKKNLRRTCVYDLSKAVPFLFLFLFLPFLSAEELFPLSLGPEGAARVSRFTNRVCRDGSGGSRLRHAP